MQSMNVAIKHEGSDITDKVISYSREHKICTGIGNLELEVTPDLIGSFTTWDKIDIYEGGGRVARYFVSQITENQPSATVTISAQDNSKRLTDYFISDTYLVDYPSYTKYWIEKFITETGLSVTFKEVGDGVLLSNNTSLGLVTAYEQVLMLLQMSGWYITFNASGNAIVGKLDIDWATVKDSINNTDIIDIKLIKHDKMLRNRVVVWGTGDPSSGRWVFADVSRPTRWDYDIRDKRTVVIANTNIPNVASAFLIANQALNEFAQITAEKHIEIVGIGDASIGTAVRVKSMVWSGKGLVTTLRVDMSKAGLITTYVLDERCPRLFAFFNPGAYVYVGTFGSGVWRKHIQYFTSGWQNYSSGLDELNITDLHVNNGVLTCVSSSGVGYYNLEDDGPWLPIAMTGLPQTSASGTILAGTYSGVMARACIIDRETDFARFAVDTRSGINLGDYLSETTPIGSGEFGGGQFQTLSGIISLSGVRSWILDVNPFNGSVSNYPVHISGNYNVCVFDIENDGVNDYLSAYALGSGLGFGGNSFSTVEFSPPVFMKDLRLTSSISVMDDIDTLDPANWTSVASLFRAEPHYVGDYGEEGQQEFVCFLDYTHLRRIRFKWDRTNPDSPTLVSEVVDSPVISPYGTTLLDIRKSSIPNVYISHVVDNNNLITITWDAGLNSISSAITRNDWRGTVDFYPPEVGVVGTVVQAFNLNYGENTYVLTEYIKNSAANFKSNGSLLYGSTISNPVKIFDTDNYLPDCGGTPSMINVAFYNASYAGAHRTAIFPRGDSFSGHVFCYVMTQRNIDADHIQRAQVLYSVLISAGGAVSTATLIEYGEIFNINTQVRSWTTGIKFGTVAYTTPGDIVATKTGLEIHDYDTLRYMQIDRDDGGAEFAVSRGSLASLQASEPSVTDVVSLWGTPNITHKIVAGVHTLNDVTVHVPSGVTSITSYSVILDENDFGAMFFGVIPSGDVPSGIYPSGVPGDLGTLFTASPTQSVGYPMAIKYAPISMPATSFFVEGRFFFSGDFFNYFGGGTVSAKTGYYVLRRMDTDYQVLWNGGYQQRLDISLYAPLVTMDRRVSSVQTFYVASDGYSQSTHITISGYNIGASGIQVSMFDAGILADDFRYADVEYTTITGVASEQTAPRTLFVLYSGAVGTIDLSTLESFSGSYLAPSGYANRIETSNFCLPDQYIFLTVSGYASDSGWGFYQKSPSGIFVDYSTGFPQARPTIIRLDDKV